ncbi:MAG: spore germination protein [Clostridia bacterium]|nr:spore germination protein [Clostridia bacterium]
MRFLDAELHVGENTDIIKREFLSMGLSCVLYYVDGLTGTAWAADYILRPLMHCREPHHGAEALHAATHQLIATPEVKTEQKPSAAVDAMMHGLCMVLLDGVSQAILIDSRFYVKRSVSTPQTETVVIGPHEAFTEPLRDNLTLLHRIMPTQKLICRMMDVGREVVTKVSLCYLQDICPQETVDEVTRRLEGCTLDDVLGSGTLSQLLEDDPFAPLPQILSTERPDRVASFLLEGQAVLLMDGSPRALAMPVSLWHLFHAPDDSYMRWQYGTFMRIIRMIGAVLALLLPALFVSIVTFHPIALPMSLLTNIIQSRSVISISLFTEALLMLTVFDLINEAGTRIPGLLGSSFGLVSALILGTAAVDAGIVSPLLLIVVALSGLGSYALPDYSLSFAFRMGQMFLLIAGGLLGLPGVCLVLVWLIMRVAGMQSFGRPYLAPTTPRRVRNPDMVVRAPIYRQRLRAYLSRPSQMLRARGRMRGRR